MEYGAFFLTPTPPPLLIHSSSTHRRGAGGGWGVVGGVCVCVCVWEGLPPDGPESLPESATTPKGPPSRRAGIPVN